MKSIAFIHSISNYKKVRDSTTNCIYICFDPLVDEILKRNGEESYFYDEFISKNEGKKATEYMYELVRTWYIINGVDFSKFEDISIGKLLEMEVFMEFGKLLKRIIAFRNIIDKFKPDELYFFYKKDDKYKEIIDILKDNYKFNVVYMPFETSKTYKSILKLKIDNLKSIISFFIHVIYALFFPVRLLRKKKKIRTFIYLNTPSIFEVWLKNEDIKNRIQLVLPYYPYFGLPKFRTFLSILWNGVEIVSFKIKSTNNDNSEIEKIKRNILSNLNNKNYKKKFIYNGIDYSPIFKKILKEIITNRVPLIYKRYYEYYKLISKLNLDLLVTKHDWEEDWQLIVEVAKKLGVETFVILHGMPVASNIRYLSQNRNADNLIVYGEGLKRLYTEIGVNPEKIHIIGYPPFDEFIKAEKKEGKYILILQHTFHPSEILDKEKADIDYIRVVKEVLKNKSDKIIYKLHPGRQDINYFRKILEYFELKWEIIDREKTLAELIPESKFVVGPASTAAMETLIVGKEYYYVKLTPMDYPPPYDGNHLKVATNVEELKYMIENNIRQPREKILREFCNVTGKEKYGYFARKLFEFLIDYSSNQKPTKQTF